MEVPFMVFIILCFAGLVVMNLYEIHQVLHKIYLLMEKGRGDGKGV